MKNYCILFFCFLLIFYNVPAQQLTNPADKTFSTIEMDRLVKKLMDTGEVTGLCIGIINNDKPAYIKSYGYKNKPRNELNDTSTCFYAASLSKPLFAYLVMQLVDEGVIDLDRSLSEYLPKPLPGYKNYKDLAGDKRWRLITARECLDHTTGFPNWRQFNPHDDQKLEIFFNPGERFAYSGEGIYLLQMIVETITGRSLEDLAEEKIFRPLGMTRTSFVWRSSFEKDYAVGHDMNEDTLPKNKRTSANAAGSMETTIADYTRFVAAVLQGKGLSVKSEHETFSPQIGIYTKHEFPSLNNDTTSAYKNINLSYGLGWGLFASKYGKAFFKEGHDEGWEHYVIGLPGEEFAIIIMTNSSNGESIFKELVENIAGIVIPWDWEGYTPYRAKVKLPEKILQQFTGEYNGKLQVTITLVNGQLKVKSETTGLPATNLYAENDHHFFLKVMDAEVDFVKDANGKIVKAIVDDEGEHYELMKVNSDNPAMPTNEKSAVIKLPKDILSVYIGTYSLSANPKRTIQIELEDDHLIARISKHESEELMFQTDAKFTFKNVPDAAGEFIKQNGKVTKFIVHQNGLFEWNKIK
jgi:CubicO group peptidase (beta-lactamase class C family)